MAIRSNELMIGDWVHLNDALSPPIYLKVYSIYPPYIQAEGELGQFRDDTLAPIPLTPEILEKNGFFIGNYGEYWMRKKKGESVNMDKDNYAIIEKGSSAIYLTCKYVHELQHALRLCEIDKEIVL